MHVCVNVLLLSFYKKYTNDSHVWIKVSLIMCKVDHIRQNLKSIVLTFFKNIHFTYYFIHHHICAKDSQMFGSIYTPTRQTCTFFTNIFKVQRFFKSVLHGFLSVEPLDIRWHRMT